MAGNICLITTLILVGPNPLLADFLEISLFYEMGVMAVFGIGYALLFVTAFGRAIKAITDLGYDLDPSTTIMITGKMPKQQNIKQITAQVVEELF